MTLNEMFLDKLIDEEKTISRLEGELSKIQSQISEARVNVDSYQKQFARDNNFHIPHKFVYWRNNLAYLISFNVDEVVTRFEVVKSFGREPVSAGIENTQHCKDHLKAVEAHENGYSI
ncbi:hypothetical protein GCM10028807_58000 [Spirosoma daeguense]